MRISGFRVLIALSVAPAACADRSSVTTLSRSTQNLIATQAPVPAADIKIFQGGAPNRPYTALGEVKVELYFDRTTFDTEVARQRVNEQLRAEAAKVRADAVVMVRYAGVSRGPKVQSNAVGVAVVFDKPSTRSPPN